MVGKTINGFPLDGDNRQTGRVATASLDEIRLITRVAKLYYERRMKQPEIARLLNVSQPRVSRLLSKAEEEGIVRITVASSPGIHADLEEALENRYSLRQAIVVDTASGDNVIRDLGAAAAYYLETTLTAKEIVGVSAWSASLLAMVNAMHPLARPTAGKVVQLLGGLGNPSAEEHATQLTQRLARLIGGEAILLPTPGVVGTQEVRQALLADEYVQHVLALYDSLTIAVVGIGETQPSKTLELSGNSFPPQEREQLATLGAVGDICLRFFDGRGAPITHLDDRVIGATLEQLAAVPRTVAVAGGRRKYAAIHGALTGRLVSVLVTDSYTARWLLDDKRAGRPGTPRPRPSRAFTG